MTASLTASPSASADRAPSPSSFRELRRARQLQARLLATREGGTTRIECGGCSRPAWGLGGDLFDFVGAGPGRLAIVIGDASGKGLAAALIATALQAALRSQYDGPAAGLGERAAALNRLLHHATAPEQYATLLLAEFDDTTAQLRYVNAGHAGAVLLRADGAVEPLPPTGTPLGLFATWSGVPAAVALRDGDALFLFSDGVSDALDPVGRRNVSRALLDAFRARAALPAAALARDLVDHARRLVPRAADDATVVVARLRPRRGADA